MLQLYLVIPILSAVLNIIGNQIEYLIYDYDMMLLQCPARENVTYKDITQHPWQLIQNSVTNNDADCTQ